MHTASRKPSSKVRPSGLTLSTVGVVRNAPVELLHLAAEYEAGRGYRPAALAIFLGSGFVSIFGFAAHRWLIRSKAAILNFFRSARTNTG